MIVNKDTNPERKLYYLGALVIEILFDSPEVDQDYLVVYRRLQEKENVSHAVFSLTLDWLYILGVIDSNAGRITRCF